MGFDFKNEQKSSRFLADENYFERIFSLGMVIKESPIHRFSRNSLFDVNLIGIIKDFYDRCNSDCTCSGFINTFKNYALEREKTCWKKKIGPFCIRVPIREVFKNDSLIFFEKSRIYLHLRVVRAENCTFDFPHRKVLINSCGDYVTDFLSLLNDSTDLYVPISPVNKNLPFELEISYEELRLCYPHSFFCSSLLTPSPFQRGIKKYKELIVPSRLKNEEWYVYFKKNEC